MFSAKTFLDFGFFFSLLFFVLMSLFFYSTGPSGRTHICFLKSCPRSTNRKIVHSVKNLRKSPFFYQNTAYKCIINNRYFHLLKYGHQSSQFHCSQPTQTKLKKTSWLLWTKTNQIKKKQVCCSIKNKTNIAKEEKPKNQKNYYRTCSFGKG
jgi:hypothetical protein